MPMNGDNGRQHSHASALHYAGFTPVEAANRLGHGVGLHWQHYAHVIESMSGTRYDDLDALIAGARAELMFPVSSRRARAAGTATAPST